MIHIGSWKEIADECNFSENVLELWVKSATDDMLLGVVFTCETEQFGYMDVETFGKTTLNDFLELYHTYNNEEGTVCYNLLKEKLYQKKHMGIRCIFWTSVYIS